MKSKKVVDKRFAKKRTEYFGVLKSIEKEGKCPFCPKNFKYHGKKVLKTKNGWLITENNWPYKNIRKHLLIIGKKHKEGLSELTKEDLIAIKYLSDWAVKKFKIKGGALAARFGETKLTGSTVCHIHFHLISPKKSKKGFAETVNFPIG